LFRVPAFDNLEFSKQLAHFTGVVLGFVNPSQLLVLFAINSLHRLHVSVQSRVEGLRFSQFSDEPVDFVEADDVGLRAKLLFLDVFGLVAERIDRFHVG